MSFAQPAVEALPTARYKPQTFRLPTVRYRRRASLVEARRSVVARSGLAKLNF